MTVLIGALRAIFATWSTGERLDLCGEFYRHTLMTPGLHAARQRLRNAADLRWVRSARADPCSACTSGEICSPQAMSKQGRRQWMATLIPDDMLHTIAACGTPDEIAVHIRDRVAGVVDRICCTSPNRSRWIRLPQTVDALRG